MEVRASQEQQGGMAGREQFGLPNSPPTPQSSGPVPNMRMTYGEDGNAYFLKPGSAPPPAETYQPGGGAGLDMPVGPDAAAAGGNGGPAFELNMEEEAAKKRGRAMKYGDDGSTSLALVPVPMPGEPTAVAPGDSGAFSQPAVKPAAGGVLAVPPVGMKKRGRPKGSTNKVKKQDKVMSALAFIGKSLSNLLHFSVITVLITFVKQLEELFTCSLFYLITCLEIRNLLPSLWTY